ncbi:hypothetical protein PsorP6_007751 [Peronosclerospora sorghi]|uniref:Uncharacterized protein n=1 Tax=Peronosclerospora sorghi TaxID=230839 RepID=A0ACC0W900_9STRA|nr:hypothetical protein PsorP6_007751 [Peronosclerospora sorghi]
MVAMGLPVAGDQASDRGDPLHATNMDGEVARICNMRLLIPTAYPWMVNLWAGQEDLGVDTQEVTGLGQPKDFCTRSRGAEFPNQTTEYCGRKGGRLNRKATGQLQQEEANNGN